MDHSIKIETQELICTCIKSVKPEFVNMGNDGCTFEAVKVEEPEFVSCGIKTETNETVVHDFINSTVGTNCGEPIYGAVKVEEREFIYKDVKPFSVDDSLTATEEVKMEFIDSCQSERFQEYEKLNQSQVNEPLSHKDVSEIKQFKCDSCDFRTKGKGSLKKHTLIHKHPSEIQWFKCDVCGFKAKAKGNLMRHIVGFTVEMCISPK
ncbi:hypothetical protein NQ315_007452 [Exocentrus adspersus]|uniref:C2H2-type domain-containing protein n=1 Tax=Exocentrus adspersus TaxID=1586481 RepID=A0AAV8VI24_9CUCU|nr:hypothetical protein NQ315_007452 [Exocentrus adspersus]